MSNQIILILAINLAFAFTNIIFKIGIIKTDLNFFIPAYLLAVLLLSLPFALREKGPKPITTRSIFGYPLITGVFHSIATFTFFLALERLPLSLLAPAAASSAVIPILLAIVFLRERPTRLQYLGIPSVIGGVIVLANPSIGIPTETSLDLISYLLVITSILSGGFMIYFSRMGVHVFGTCRFLTLSVFFSTFPIALIFSSDFINSMGNSSSEGIIYVIAAGAIVVSGRLVLFKAMKEIPMTFLMPMISLFPIIPMAFGIIFLGESLSMIQITGAAFVIIGIMMINSKHLT